MRGILRAWLGLNMLQQLLIAVVAGLVAGYLFPAIGPAIKPLGDIVLRLIKMIIVPLIFASIAMSVLELKEVGKAARVGGLSFGLYLLTTLCATVLAVTIAGFAFQWISIPTAEQLTPGDLSNISKGAESYGGFWGTIFTIVPDNLLKAFVEGNTLATIVFAVAIGMLILKMKSDEDSEQGHQLERMLRAVTRLIYRFIDYVIKAMPFAVFAFIAWMVATQDYEVFAALAQMLAVGFGILILHVLITYGTLLKVVGRVKLSTFLRKIAPVQLFAFSSASSAATIPLNERVLQNKIGVSKETSSFTVPFGATVNMDGTAIAQCTYAIFIAHMYGIDLTLMQYVTLAVMSAIVSVGVAAVPSASLVTLSVVLGVVGIPAEGIAFILATDRLFDMARTAVNVTGDASVSIAVDRLEGRFNDRMFNMPADEQDLETHPSTV